MSTPDLTGLTSAVDTLSANQIATNELLQKLVDHFTPADVPEPDPEAKKNVNIFKALGSAALRTVAVLTAANAALLVFSRTLTKQAELLGGAVEREVASQMITRQMWGPAFEGVGPDAVQKTISTVIEDLGVVPDFQSATPGLQQMGQLREEYGIDLSNIIDPVRMMLATRAAGSFNEAMDEMVKTRQELAGRGLNVNKALKQIRSLPDLVAKFGGTANEQMINLITSSQKLGISARALQDSVLGLAGDRKSVV